MGNRLLILIVEDEDDHYRLIERGLEASNHFQTERANSVQEARAKILSLQPGLVITDWKLPDGNGIDLIEKESNDRHQYPVIVMTSHGNEAWAVEAIKRGALDYIVKSPDALSGMTRIAERTLREWRHIAARKKAEQEREQVIRELQQALERVETLSGLLPICANCKNIRNDDGYWQRIETYIGARSKAEFSHGMCPNCAKKLYPKFFEQK